MPAPYRISVVVPTYGRVECVRRLLDALVRQSLPADEFEVIISVDGSDDGTNEMVRRFSAPYELQALFQRHHGRAGACNTGIRTARGELLVLLDDDMEPIPSFLAAHKSAHQSNVRLGVVGAVPMLVQHDSSPVVRYVAEKFNAHLEALGQPGYDLKLRDFYSGNFSIRRSVLLEAGAFDEAFTIYGNEDLDLFRRLRQAGVRVIYDVNALSYQYYTKNFPALVQDNVDKGRTTIQLVCKDPEVFADSKLNAHQSLKWRLIRWLLLGISARWQGMAGAMMAFMSWLERRSPSNFVRLCPIALDYFFWSGVQSALQESGQGSSGNSADPRRCD